MRGGGEWWGWSSIPQRVSYSRSTAEYLSYSAPRPLDPSLSPSRERKSPRTRHRFMEQMTPRRLPRGTLQHRKYNCILVLPPRRASLSTPPKREPEAGTSGSPAVPTPNTGHCACPRGKCSHEARAFERREVCRPTGSVEPGSARAPTDNISRGLILRPILCPPPPLQRTRNGRGQRRPALGPSRDGARRRDDLRAPRRARGAVRAGLGVRPVRSAPRTHASRCWVPSCSSALGAHGWVLVWQGICEMHEPGRQSGPGLRQ